VPRIVLTNRIPASPQQCFELSLSVDAHTASMSHSEERAVGGVTSGLLRLGDTVSWHAKHFGLPFTMTVRISEFDAPQRFVDEQVSGPFRSWWHEHLFEPVAGGGTLMTDTVEFEAPAGAVGRVVSRFVLTGYLTRLLAGRNRWLIEALSPPAA